jgi:serine/threonine protein kinase
VTRVRTLNNYRANILVSDSGRAVLADFGLAKISLETTMTNLRDSGSPRWMAPELFSFSDIEEITHKTLMSDIYAFGQVIAEVVSFNPYHKILFISGRF